MVSATFLRSKLEASLAERIPSAFTPRIRQAPELFPTGIAELDALLEGGIPRGGITEITGSPTTGRTALALSLLALVTCKGGACAWVDAQDALDPESALAHGVNLERLLWLRAGGADFETRAPKRLLTQKPAPHTANQFTQGARGLHPRNETRSMNQAVSQLFLGNGALLWCEKVGTPGTPNRTLEFSAMGPRCAEAQPHRREVEQVASDRLLPRRGEVALERQAGMRFGETPGRQERDLSHRKPVRAAKPQSWLDQALRATDLLLQAGGFGVIVLDMSDVGPEHIMRIPIASWHRFRLAAEQSQAALILLSQAPCAKSCAALVLRCDRVEETGRWRDGMETTLFTSLRYRTTTERRRSEGIDPTHKKAVANATAAWQTSTPWAR